MNIIDEIEKEQMERELSEFTPGDTVRVNVRIQEGGKERIQAFEGVVIRVRKRGVRSTFTVRKVSFEGLNPLFYVRTTGLSTVHSSGRLSWLESSTCVIVWRPRPDSELERRTGVP